METATQQAALVRSGEVSARELVEASLATIERANPLVNAFSYVAAERARSEAELVRKGDTRPLCGVPIAVKDLLGATAGLPTTNGSGGFGDWVASHDTAHVRRLREAGAIIVGKTTTPEIGLRPVTESARYGVTRNPRRPDLAAGGSSGGSAAAVAGEMVSLAEGSDLGGSIRIPAACCGVVGFKPSRGRVSIGPDFGDLGGGAAVDGPLARTVGDAALAFEVIAGYEPGDHHWLGPVTELPNTPAVRYTVTAPLGVPVDPEPRAGAERATALLPDVLEWTPDWDDESFPAAWSTFVTGTVQHMVRVVERLHRRDVDADRLEPATRAWAIESAPVALVDYLEAKEQLIAFSRRVISTWPADGVLITPTLTRLPPSVESLQSQAGVTDDALRLSAFVRIFNVTGQPAISLPLHETQDGVPVGVQLVGPPGRDDLVLALAAQLEQAAA